MVGIRELIERERRRIEEERKRRGSSRKSAEWYKSREEFRRIIKLISTDIPLPYSTAASYTGLSVRYLRHLVRAQRIPVYGPPRSRRFRIDMLDLWLENRNAAMRKFQEEEKARRGN